jgi:membrane protein implicated in regulation of membrane protease activity
MLDWLSRNVLAERLLLYATVIIVVTVIAWRIPLGTTGFLVAFLVAFILAEAWRRWFRRQRSRSHPSTVDGV